MHNIKVRLNRVYTIRQLAQPMVVQFYHGGIEPTQSIKLSLTINNIIEAVGAYAILQSENQINV